MQLSNALAHAQKYLAKRERTESDLYQELLKFGCSADLSQEVLAKAKEHDWVCDQRFCLRFCEQQLCKGYGPIKITDALRDKGVKPSVIVNCVSEIEHSTWEHAAMLALEKKFGRDYRSARRLELINYLERRGFNDDYMMFLVRED